MSGRWRFNSGIRHAEWVIGGTLVEGTKKENGGRPVVMYAVIPASDVTLYDNWSDVVGLKGTGSCDCSVENYELPEHIRLGSAQAEAAPRRPLLSAAAFQLCCEGARQRRNRRGEARARRTDQHRDHDAWHLQIVKA